MNTHEQSTGARRAAASATIALATAALLLGGPRSTSVAADAAASAAISSEPLAKPIGGQSSTLFETVDAKRSGIDFVHVWKPLEKYAERISGPFAGSGVCIGDYDDDGLDDVFLTQQYGGHRLYRNLGNFRFEDATTAAGVRDDGTWGSGATFVDIDNDGDLDLYVCAFATPNRLFINQGDGTFVERGSEWGLDFTGASVMMAFADYDMDGDLDAYLVNNRSSSADITYTAKLDAFLENPKLEFRDGRMQVPVELERRADVLILADGSARVIRAGDVDRLFRNNLIGADGRPGKGFTDVTEEAGIGGKHFGLSASWWDYDHDGDPDLYVANDFFSPDVLYRNEGDGTFVNVIDKVVRHTPWFSMGTDTADINNDGLLDLMGSDMSGSSHYKSKIAMGDMDLDGWFLEYGEPRQYMRNAVYVNSGANQFMEVAHMADLDSTDWTWSVKFGDLDNDGLVDVYISNGMTRQWFNSDIRGQNRFAGGIRTEKWMDTPKQEEANMAFRNLGDLQFAHIGKEWGLDHVGVSFGAALGDLTGDGNLDLVVNNFEEAASVYRNTGAPGHRIKIRLVGTASNRDGIGAVIRLRAGDSQQTRYLTLARGFMAANPPRVFFGLGDSEVVDSLSVEWPSGRVQTFTELAADRYYTIREPAGDSPSKAASPAADTMFTRGKTPRAAIRKETPYDDFKRQPLLPNQLSQLGPALACADIDGDGDDDFYLGGPAGLPGIVCLNMGGGRFRWTDANFRGGDRAHEEMGALFLDCDADGDMDLYVASGGVECEPQDAVLRDRLYLNDGKGRFAAAPADALPDVRDSGGPVVAADMDRDGDLDLFVGGRVVPGQYPTAPESRLLRNDGGRFTDVTDTAASSLRHSGMATAALWSDADNDGWPDLLVAYEWGPVRLYRNDRGTLVDQTAKAGLADLLGWWNSVAGRDIDNDGDIDYVIGNFGLNTKYHPSPKNPSIIYYGDFEGTGRKHIVEVKQKGETALPVRGKSCSQNAMPFVSEKFPMFHQFALATVDEIYTDERLDSALRVEATILESGVLINDGTGAFKFHPLPRLAQISPAFGLVLTDLNGDGNVDLYMAQNFYTPQRETGRMDGGLSLLLTGDGSGAFTPIWPNRSGLVVPGDARSLVPTDINDDGWVDFAIGVNDDELLTFINRGSSDARMFNLRLRGGPGNPTAVGARVTVQTTDGRRQTAEVTAGSGYMSQSSGALAFGLGRDGEVDRIEIRWPDGRTTTEKPGKTTGTLTIDQG